MDFETAFRKILETRDIEVTAGCDYLYEIEGFNKLFTEEEVIKLAETL